MPSMFDTCIEVFRDAVVSSKTHQVKKNVISALIGVVNNFRDGGLVNKSLLAEIFRILSSIPSSLGLSFQNKSTLLNSSFIFFLNSLSLSSCQNE